MAKLRCVCLYDIPISGTIPNPNEWKMLSDTDFDSFAGLIEAEDIYLASGSMFRCPNCGRLWVYWNGFDHDPQCYQPEAMVETSADSEG